RSSSQRIACRTVSSALGSVDQRKSKMSPPKMNVPARAAAAWIAGSCRAASDRREQRWRSDTKNVRDIYYSLLTDSPLTPSSLLPNWQAVPDRQVLGNHMPHGPLWASKYCLSPPGRDQNRPPPASPKSRKLCSANDKLQ